MSVGIRGGYELWEIGIGHCIDKAMSKNPKRFPQGRRHVIRSKLLDGFFNSKARINFNNPHRLHADLVNCFNDRKAFYTVSITSEQLKQEWESAFRDAINLAAQNIRRVARTGRKLKVLLTGGSANSHNLRNEIKNVCSQLCEQGFDVICNAVEKELDVVLIPYADPPDIADPFFPPMQRLTDALSSRKWSIAEGAACCHATAMEVEEFFDLGAAFALQKQVATPNEEEWAECGELLFCKVSPVPPPLSST